AELDPMVTGIVQDKMYVDTSGMNIMHGDARNILQKLENEKFDVVVTDAFHDIAIPYHLVTQEYVQLVKSRMKPGGLFTTNVVDVHPDPRMVKSMIKTLQTSFKTVDVWLHQLPEKPERMTYVISASDRQTMEAEFFMSSSGLRRNWYKVNVPLLATGTSVEELPVFTDDYVPVERMISGLLLTAEGL
ncbi:MAG: fused MFS/spermidine synthase, partial [Gammaproteobacteria bacterium]|nr:fused MFS/spermidine synthase [Gammaproteobacteria bacterium]NNJ92645.1 fused MFS/spermidine synthase [Gammaproteobacteria bacterium]